MAFFRERFSKLTKLWTVSSVSISQYNSKRLAKDIEKESTVSYTDIMAVLTSLPTVMQRYLAEGHTVKLEGIGTFYISVQCSKTGVEKKELCSAEQITNVKVQFRPEMETPSTGRKGKRKNTLVADGLSWTYLPATEKKTTEEGVGTPTPTPDPTPGARRRLKDNNARKRLNAQSPQSIITLPQKTMHPPVEKIPRGALT